MLRCEACFKRYEDNNRKISCHGKVNPGNPKIYFTILLYNVILSKEFCFHNFIVFSHVTQPMILEDMVKREKRKVFRLYNMVDLMCHICTENPI